jgi:hypothetical protein
MPLEQAFGDLLAVLPGDQRAELLGVRVEAVGHLAQGSVAQAAVPGPGGGIERAAGGRDGRAGLGLAAVGPAPRR